MAGCFLKKDKKLIRNGVYSLYNKKGERLRVIKYKDNKLVKDNKKSFEPTKAPEAFKQLVASILPSLKKPKTSKFQTYKCENDHVKWIKLFIFNSPFSMKYDYQKGCDLNGGFTPQVNKEFPVKLKLRNLNGFEKVDMNILMTPKLTNSLGVELSFKANKSKLYYQKNTIRFNGDYRIELDSSGVVTKNHGGYFQAYRFNQNKINFKEKIFIKKAE